MEGGGGAYWISTDFFILLSCFSTLFSRYFSFLKNCRCRPQIRSLSVEWFYVYDKLAWYQLLFLERNYIPWRLEIQRNIIIEIRGLWRYILDEKSPDYTLNSTNNCIIFEKHLFQSSTRYSLNCRIPLIKRILILIDKIVCVYLFKKKKKKKKMNNERIKWS